MFIAFVQQPVAFIGAQMLLFSETYWKKFERESASTSCFKIKEHA